MSGINIFDVWAAAVSGVLIFFSYRALRFRGGIKTLSEIANHHQFEAWRKISIVIPACNEEDTIESAIVDLLKVNYANLEIVIVNDRSIDRTGEIINRLAATDSRIKAVHIDHLPEGWLGKVHALQRGLEFTSGRWVLFMDADVHFAPDAIKKAVLHAYNNQLDFLAVIPDISAPGLLLQMGMAQLFHQASILLDPRRVNDPRHKICYGQGAFMLLRRNVYERSEGLEWLKMEAVDDTGLAILMRRAGAKMGVISGLNEISIEWYKTFPALVKGLEKNSFAVCQYRVSILVAGIFAALFLVAGYTIAPFFSHSVIVRCLSVAATLLYLVAIRAQLKTILKVPLKAVLLFPISSFFLPLICIRAAILLKWRGGLTWRGTFYSINELKTGQRVRPSNLSFQYQATPTSVPSEPLERPRETASM